MIEVKINITGLNPIAEAIAMLASVLAIGKHAKAPGLNMEVPVYTEEKEKPKEEPKKETKKEPAKTFTKEEIRKAFMAKNSAENRPALKQILEDFGTPNISNLAEEHFAAAMERLEALS